jgi:uncharacterized protein (DUF1800 family)
MRRLLFAFAFAFLVACGGGGGGAPSGGGGSPGAPPPAAPAPPTRAESGRFLTQATFGPTEAEITALQSSSFSAWITAQLALPLPAQSHQAYLDARLAQLQQTNGNAQLSPNQFYESWWKQAATSPDQLRQRVTFALSQIFVISMADPNIDVRGAGSYYDMLARNALGNFRTLLDEVTLHPMMGRYLTYLANQREDGSGTRTPDENYAREVMQLMTIGLYELNPDGTLRTNAQGQPIPTYTPADIAGLAKVFTGISWYHPSPSNNTFFGGNAHSDRSVRPMIFYPQYHSISAKNFLNVTIAPTTTATADTMTSELKTALDTLFNHPNVGPFIASRLIQQLVTSNPTPAYVGRVAAVFNNNGSGTRGDMAAVIRAILTDVEARSAATAASPSFGKLREPVIRTTNWMRAFGVTSQSGNWLMSSTSANTSLAQSPLNSNSVFNFWRPGFVPPATTELGQRNLLAPEFQAVDEVTTAAWVNLALDWVNNGVGGTPPGGSGRDISSTYAAEMALADNPQLLVDRINTLLFYDSMNATLRGNLIAAVTAVPIPGGTPTPAQVDAARLNRVKTAIGFAMISPDYLIQR